MKSLNLFFLVIAVMSMVACGKKIDTNKVIELQKEQTEKWEKDFNAGDADAIASMYTEDAIRMEQHVPVLKGREAIQAFLKTFFYQTEVSVELEVVSVEITGDYAILQGTSTLNGKQKSDGTPIHDEGKWVAISKLQADGIWKTILDIWNSDLPPVVPNP